MREGMKDGIYESQAFALQGINVHKLGLKLKVAELRFHNVRHEQDQPRGIITSLLHHSRCKTFLALQSRSRLGVAC